MSRAITIPTTVAAPRPRLITPAFVRLGLATLAYFIADGILLPALPRYVAGPLGGGDAAVGISVGAFSISAFFLRPWVGRLGDRRGRRLLLLGGAAVFTASVLGYLAASSVGMLVALRLLTGAGEAAFFVGAFTMASDLAPPQRRGEAMSLFSLALYVGIGVGPLVGEALVEGPGFASAWIAAAGAAALAAFLATRLPPALPEGGGGGRHPLIDRRGLLPGFLMLASIWGMAAFLAFIPLYALDAGLEGSRVVLLLFSGIVVGIRSLGARIPDKLGPVRATRVALALSAAGLGVLGLAGSPAGLLAGTAVFAVGIALFTPALLTMAVDGVPPAQRAAVMGTTSAFLDLAFGLGPATVGLVAGTVGRGGGFLAGAGVAMAGLVVALAAGRRAPAPAGAGPA